VEVVCKRYSVPLLHSLDDLIGEIRQALSIRRS
jgi:hypothetical protein